MRGVPHIAALCVLGLPLLAAGQSLTPLADPIEEPLLPTGISPGDVELFGRRVYLSETDDGTEVLHLVGEFELHLDRRRYLSAREAIIFLSRQTFAGRPFQHFEVYLWRDAHVTESAGTVTTGPVLYVVLNNSGKVSIGADDTARGPLPDTPVYHDAQRMHRLLAEAELGDVATAPPIRVIDPTAATKTAEPQVRPFVTYRADDVEGGWVEDQQVVTAIGHVFVFQGGRPGEPPLELRADSAVLFLAAKPEEPAPDAADLPPRDLQDEEQGAAGVEIGGVSAADLDSEAEIEAAYLEGDVVLTRGERMIRASQIYYDLARDQALVLDAVARVIEPQRDVPIYVRAARVRQLSRTEYAGWNARISTSEFYSPHFHVGATEVHFTDETSRSSAGVAAGLRAGTYEMKHTSFRLYDVPVAYWPWAKGEFREGESIIRGIRTGFSNNFGATLETEWHLFSLLGVERPVGFDGTFRADYYSDRGPGVGIDLDYERDDYFGLFRGYFIHDDGQDTLGRFRDEEPDTTTRGRATLRHRHYLPDDWQLTLEASYLSDRGFLEEYFEPEFDEGKDQENLVYLKKQVDTWSFTALAQTRWHDWLTQTEHLPDFEFRLLGESLGDFATLFSENRGGWVRYRPGERELLEYLFLKPRENASGTVARADSRQEVEVPLTLGPVKVVPFSSIRGSAWDDSPYSGGLSRAFGVAGLRGSMYLSRVFPDVHSDLLDVDGIRHVIKPDLTAWAAGSNVDSFELYPFTPNVEDIDELDGVTLGVRQRWQTRRGGPGQRRTVDLVSLDLETGFFNDAQSAERTFGFASYSRPENSISRNYANATVNWRINDSTALISEANYDVNDGELDGLNVSLVAERDPRFSYLVAYRFIEEINSSLLAVGANYKLTDKHTIAFRESFDIDRGKTQEFTVGFIRKFPRWYVGLTVDLNEADDDFGISLSAWPEGLPRTAIGSRRFTGLAESTGIRPE